MTKPPLKLLLICHANVCRSPMAESVFRHVLADVYDAQIHSAGVEAMSGAPAHPLARAALSSRGYGLPDEANALRLSQPMLEWADLAFAMERSQRLEIIRRYPVAARKLWTLGHWLDREIDDPVGGDAARFDATLDLIELSAWSWLPALNQQLSL
ncbi:MULTISPECIES: hypothetical protein [Paraburkholderia]|uniref:protein-tyrosine-phosphatase n=1 Tax=Paraburkholderia tropica TaxID=92647 RepID=A0A1A5XMA6_9BURK|nr:MULTISPECIES: hypothetical protein [Paraburkholderia]MBB2980086.1 protein-tyrosine phosphatase [Paraburkholderia tropica]MBB3002667.1 protein-tyrosine phosphatase [Paraburkholderia tropica]MBB6321976.1 protein-tyrosine phosphatase [Paraburkholderia tropica]OBR54278.1 hypothetical protein A6456_16135 [Paraburkholderia tropica]QNB16328.1 hypothetical protein G5S35_32380 [Paraburkholderia tropica]